MSWWVYIIRCDDDSLYTGISTDVDRRFSEHTGQTGGKYKGAKFFYGRKPLKVVYRQQLSDRSAASKCEYKIKQLNRKQKLQLIDHGKVSSPMQR
ncbi:MAG: GIY-YIG nuclease family protein [Xanthomonadales bacterium]|nr:GIY-YIG nuclease family protein [Xanthomonadales bacterium]